MSNIIPGTNKNVWIFEDLNTIASYYPGLDDKSGGIAGTESFFFNYKKAIDNIKKEFKDKLAEDYEPKFTDNPEPYVNYRKIEGLTDGVKLGQFSPSDYPYTRKLIKIATAQARYLTSTQAQPLLNFFLPDRFYTFLGFNNQGQRIDPIGFDSSPPMKIWKVLDNSFFNLKWASYMGVSQLRDKTIYNPILNETLISSKPAYFKGTKKALPVEEKWNALHPFAHFPALTKDTLDQNGQALPFFDIGARDAETAKLQKWYGAQGLLLAETIKKNNKTVYYSDIITPSSQGYGFEINFRNICNLPIMPKYSVPIDEWFRDERFMLYLWKASNSGKKEFINMFSDSTAGRNVSYKYGGYGPTIIGEIKTLYIPDIIWGCSEKEMNVLWTRRDDWIMNFISGGKIPWEITDICHCWNDYPITLKECSWLKDVFPFYLVHKEKSFWEELVEPLFIIATIAVAIAQGNWGSLLATSTQVLSKVIQNAFPSIAKYVRFGTIVSIAMISSRFKATQQEKDAKKISQTMLDIAGPMIQIPMGKSTDDVSADLQSTVEGVLNYTDKVDLETISLIGEQIDKNKTLGDIASQYVNAEKSKQAANLATDIAATQKNEASRQAALKKYTEAQKAKVAAANATQKLIADQKNKNILFWSIGLVGITYVIKKLKKSKS